MRYRNRKCKFIKIFNEKPVQKQILKYMKKYFMRSKLNIKM